MHNEPAFIQDIAPIIHQFGYLAVGGLLLIEDFGIPVPGETVLIAASFYAGLGDLNIFVVILVGFLGAVLGDNIGFAIGQYGGHPLILKFGKYIFLTPERLDRAKAFFDNHGGKVVTIARFVEGLRQLNGILAGLSSMRWPKFIVFNMLGAALWVSTWATIGYFGGEHITTLLHYQLYFTIAVIIFVAAYAAWWFLKKKKI